MGNNIKICEHCGHKSVEYKFGFNKGLAAFLSKLYLAGKPCRTNDLDLTYAQRTNSQKLRYWGLAVPHENEESKIKKGVWVITQKGRDFVEHELQIHKHVIMCNNKLVKYEGDMIWFNDVSDGYQYRKDYQEQASTQVNLF